MHQALGSICSRGSSLQNGPEEVPLSRAWPSSMTAAASCGLRKPGGKVKATLSLGVIEDDNSILRLTETSGDQSQHEGAAETGWNSPAILKLLKLATVTTVSMKTAGSPTLWRDKGLTMGRAWCKLALTMVQTSGWITGPEMTKMESGSHLGVGRNQRALKHL